MEIRENMTQRDFILGHLKDYGSIEPLTALREYGVYRLSAVIYDLRHEGYNISMETMSARSRITGRPVQYARYTLQS